MSINLSEFRTAVIAYLDNKVTVTISSITPAVGTSLGPNEDFTFTLTVRNADASNGGIQLKAVVWYIWVQSGSVAKLYVPTQNNGVAFSSYPPISTGMLTPGAQVDGMYLIRVGNTLNVGEYESLQMKGRSGTSAAGGSTNINFKVFADVDMAWLVPAQQDSALVSKPVVVVG